MSEPKIDLNSNLLARATLLQLMVVSSISGLVFIAIGKAAGLSVFLGCITVAIPNIYFIAAYTRTIGMDGKQFLSRIARAEFIKFLLLIVIAIAVFKNVKLLLGAWFFLGIVTTYISCNLGLFFLKKK